jgi:hypothetical protein
VDAIIIDNWTETNRFSETEGVIGVGTRRHEEVVGTVPV